MSERQCRMIRAAEGLLMKLLLTTLAVALVLASPALAESTGDFRAPDQQASPTHKPAPAQDFRAPDRQAPPARKSAGTNDPRAPDQRAGQTPSVPAPVSAGGTAAIVFMLIGVGVGLLLVIGGYLVARHRRSQLLEDGSRLEKAHEKRRLKREHTGDTPEAEAERREAAATAADYDADTMKNRVGNPGASFFS